MRALSEFEGVDASEVLASALQDSHRKVRLEASRALRILADSDTRPMIVQALMEALRQPRMDLPFINALIQTVTVVGKQPGTAMRLAPARAVRWPGSSGRP